MPSLACELSRGEDRTFRESKARIIMNHRVQRSYQRPRINFSVSQWTTKRPIERYTFQMFAPRFQSFIRPASNRASQCLRQRRAAIPKSSVSGQIRQQRHQSTRSTAAAAKALFKAYPFSVTAAFALYVASSHHTSPLLTCPAQNPLRSWHADVLQLYLSELYHWSFPQVPRARREAAAQSPLLHEYFSGTPRSCQILQGSPTSRRRNWNGPLFGRDHRS